MPVIRSVKENVSGLFIVVLESCVGRSVGNYWCSRIFYAATSKVQCTANLA